MKKIAPILLIATAISFNVSAKGIKYVEYNRDNVPNIITAAGIASEIIFEDDETIEYATFGFDAAWDSATVRDHILVFKAQDEQPETNLIVHTDKRDYLFTVTTGNNEWKNNPNNSGAYYSVRMVYHDKKSKKALADDAAKTEQNSLRNQSISQSSYVYSNYDYRATENANDILPRRAWDNGTLTFIAFAPGSKRGVVYELGSDGKASLVNQHTEKNGLLVVHGVFHKLILRLGDQAVELRRNDRYGQRENLTKTNVERTWRYTQDTAPVKFKEEKKQKLSLMPPPPKDLTSEDDGVMVETFPDSDFGDPNGRPQ